MIDQVWSKLATTLMCGGLGPSVYMVKVSPVQDIQPEQARGEHVICVYNTNYKDTEQVMRVENLMRSAGVTTILTYKPDIFSALGIYRNNKWGLRPTIYSSRVLLMEGKSRVETVGTGNWYYNSSKGLQYPAEGKVVRNDESKGVGKENNAKVVQQEEVKIKKSDASGEKLNVEKKDDLKITCKTPLGGVNPPPLPQIQLGIQNKDDMKSAEKSEPIEKSVLCIEDLEAMKMFSKYDSNDTKLKQSSDKKSAPKKGAKSKKNRKYSLEKVDEDNVDKKTLDSDCNQKVQPLSRRKNGIDEYDNKTS